MHSRLIARAALQFKHCRQVQATMSQYHNVHHDQENNQFIISLAASNDNAVNANGETTKAVLDYAWEDSGVMDLYHTEVPEALRGQGIAKHLAKAAFDYAVQNQKKMVLTCSYLQKYAKENASAEEQQLILNS